MKIVVNKTKIGIVLPNKLSLQNNSIAKFATNLFLIMHINEPRCILIKYIFTASNKKKFQRFQRIIIKIVYCKCLGDKSE